VRAQDWGTTTASNPTYTGISSSSPRAAASCRRRSFDPRKFSISNSLVFGYSSGGSGYGNGSAGLFTSSLGYQLKPNMALHVNVGAHMNPAFGGSDRPPAVSSRVRPSTGARRRTRSCASSTATSARRMQSPWGYAPRTATGRGCGRQRPVAQLTV
jgi:hypothetical protein